MRKWGIALAAAGLLAAGAQAGDLQFVPVNTGQNLAAPVPQYYGPVPQKKSLLGRVGDVIKSPFVSKKVLPTPPRPAMVTSAPAQNLLNKVGTLLSPSKAISGGVK